MAFAGLIMAAGQMVQQQQAATLQQREAMKEARELDRQTRIMKAEGRAAARQSEAENQKFLAQQKMSYVANGVDMAGSPLLVLDETDRIGREEVRALKSSFYNKARLNKQRSKRVLNQGRAALINADIKSTATGAKAAGGFVKGGGSFDSFNFNKGKSASDPNIGKNDRIVT